MFRLVSTAIATSTCLLLLSPAVAQRNVQISRTANDLAAFVEGTYSGDVISDARGSSKSGVTVWVSQVGPNLVEVRSDYSRIPTVRIPLEQALSAIVAASGDHVFLINRDEDLNRLSLTIDDASLSLSRR